MRQVHVGAVALLLGAGLLAAQLAQTGPSALAQGEGAEVSALPSCPPLRIENPLSSLTSAAWRADRLLLVDAPSRRLVQLELDDRARLRPIEAGINQTLSTIQPVRIRSQGGGNSSSEGFIIELEARHSFMALDRRLRFRDIRALWEAGSPGGGRDGGREEGGREVAALWDWVVAGNDIVGYADIAVHGRGGEEDVTWKTGFVRFPTGTPAAARVLGEMRAYPDQMRSFYRLSYPLVANLGNRAFAFFFDDTMEIVALDGMRRLKSLPEHLMHKLPPLLPELLTADNFHWVMEQVEQSSMPAGLHGWGGHLFVLSRSSSDGQTSWFITKIAPDSDKLLWTKKIPSTANHMTVVPGPVRWAFLERGPVTSDLEQQTTAVRLIDAAHMVEKPDREDGFLCR